MQPGRIKVILPYEVGRLYEMVISDTLYYLGNHNHKDIQREVIETLFNEFLSYQLSGHFQLKLLEENSELSSDDKDEIGTMLYEELACVVDYLDSYEFDSELIETFIYFIEDTYEEDINEMIDCISNKLYLSYSGQDELDLYHDTDGDFIGLSSVTIWNIEKWKSDVVYLTN